MKYNTFFHRSVSLLLALITFCLPLFSCSGDEPYYAPEESYEKTTAEKTEIEENPDGRLHLISDFAARAAIVYSERAGSDEIALAEELAHIIQLRTGVAPKVRSDYVSKVEDTDTKDTEILLGLTNRPASVKLNSSLERRTFAIESTENKLVIAGKNISMLTLAVKYFAENIMTSEAVRLEKGNFSLDVGIKYVSEKAEPTPENIMESGISLLLTSERLAELEGFGEHKVIGGACTDGEYFYTVMRSASMDLSTMSYTGIVIKYSLPSFTVTAKSEILDLGLGADMDYDETSSSLVILHGNVSGKEKISFMTTGLLRVTSSVTVSRSLDSLCSLGNGEFAACASDKKELYILDKNFSVKDSHSLHLLSGDISAMTTDGRYIYVLTNAKTMINVYTYGGEYVNRIALNSPLEAKNIMFYGKDLTVGFCNAYWSGGEIYRVTLELKE